MSATEPQPEVVYRYLQPEEFARVTHVFEGYKVRPPSPSSSVIFAAVAGDEVVGFFTFQMMPHGEPIYVAPEWRGRVDWRRLVAGVDSLMPEGAFYVVLATSPQVEHMARESGLREVEGKLFIKEF